tara:strand:- start:265 stop:366 length:102 start_codon:yes stop_codon:yes gene_type:complete
MSALMILQKKNLDSPIKNDIENASDGIEDGQTT